METPLTLISLALLTSPPALPPSICFRRPTPTLYLRQTASVFLCGSSSSWTGRRRRDLPGTMRGSVSMRISLIMTMRCPGVAVCACVSAKASMNAHVSACDLLLSTLHSLPTSNPSFNPSRCHRVPPLRLTLLVPCITPHGNVCRWRLSTISGLASSKTTSRRFSCLSRPSKPQRSQRPVSGGTTTVWPSLV